MKVIICCNSHSACGEYRVFEPYVNLNSDIEFIHWNFIYNKNVDELDADVIFFQRPNEENILQFIREVVKSGRKVVIETDDDMLNIPYSSPVHHLSKGRQAKVYEQCMKESSYIHVSTPELKRNDKATVFLNAINLKKYGEGMKDFFRIENNIPIGNKIILWQGSQTHEDSLLLIRDALIELSNRSNITVVLWGEVNWFKKIGYDKYGFILKDIVPFEISYRIPSIADINLTPLPVNKFNVCKSELKVLEAAAWSVPSVSSKIAPYIRFNQLADGGNLIVPKERTKDWLKAIDRLLEDQELYKSCSEKSYKAIQTTYNLDTINGQRKVWWENLSKLLIPLGHEDHQTA